MPLTKDENKGTNKDGSKNEEYCGDCYQDGEYTDNMTEKMILAETIVNDSSLNFPPNSLCAKVARKTKEDLLRELLGEEFPTLKRWKELL